MQKGSKKLVIWECKECNRQVEDEDCVAFHLINGILYGWCRSCFEKATARRVQKSYDQAA